VGSALVWEESGSLSAWDRWHFLEKQIQMSLSITHSGALICVDSEVLETVSGLSQTGAPVVCRYISST